MITYIMGPSCAGKTTFAQGSRKPGDVVMDFDALTKALGSDIDHDAPEDILDVAFTMRAVGENRIHEGIKSDAWIIRSWLPEDRIKSLGESGARFVVLDPGEEVALHRADLDGRPPHTKDNIRRWYESPPQIPAEFLISAPGSTKEGNSVRTKTAVVEVEAVPESEGSFIGYAAIFNNIDSVSDMVMPGAFTKSLQDFGPNGSGIPCYWGHQMDDPMMCIGWTKSAVEDERGLRVEVELDLDNPNGAQVYKMMKRGVINQMSFAYDIKDFAISSTPTGDDYWELRELKIHEVSVVQVGANQETELLSVKNRISDIRATTLPRGVAERLEKANTLISSALSEVASESPEDSRDEEPAKDTPEEGESPNGKDPDLVKSRTLALADDVESIFNNLRTKGI